MIPRRLSRRSHAPHRQYIFQWCKVSALGQRRTYEQCRPHLYFHLLKNLVDSFEVRKTRTAYARRFSIGGVHRQQGLHEVTIDVGVHSCQCKLDWGTPWRGPVLKQRLPRRRSRDAPLLLSRREGCEIEVGKDEIE